MADYQNKFPDRYNVLQNKVGNIFNPYTNDWGYDRFLYKPEQQGVYGKYVRLVEMSPEKYIQKAYKGFLGLGNKNGINPQVIKQSIIDRGKDESIKTIQGMLEKGEKLHIPYLDYSGNDFTQEGIHRSAVLNARGVNKIPVAIYGDNPRQVTKLASRFGKILLGLPLNELGLGADYLPVLDLIITKDKGQYNKKLEKMFKDAGINYNNGQFQL